MKNGLKKFLAMLSVMGLVSGAGTIGCAAYDTSKDIAPPASASSTLYYELLKDKTLAKDQEDLFDKCTFYGRTLYKSKSDADKAKLAEALKLFGNPLVLVSNDKIGLSTGKVVGIGAGAALTAVVVDEVVHFFCSK